MLLIPNVFDPCSRLNLTGTLVRHNRGEGEALKQHLREMENLAESLETGSTPSFQNSGESHRQPSPGHCPTELPAGALIGGILIPILSSPMMTFKDDGAC